MRALALLLLLGLLVSAPGVAAPSPEAPAKAGGRSGPAALERARALRGPRMPHLHGLTAEQARARLRDAGIGDCLEAGTPTKKREELGRVLDQEPRAGTLLRRWPRTPTFAVGVPPRPAAPELPDRPKQPPPRGGPGLLSWVLFGVANLVLLVLFRRRVDRLPALSIPGEAGTSEKPSVEFLPPTRKGR